MIDQRDIDHDLENIAEMVCPGITSNSNWVKIFIERVSTDEKAFKVFSHYVDELCPTRGFLKKGQEFEQYVSQLIHPYK